jgi:hypothetical protein
MGITRRTLVKAAAGAALVAGVSATVRADAQRGCIVVYDPALTGLYGQITALAEAARSIALEPDAVRQWRDGLGALCLQAHEVTALVRWHHGMVLGGLLREARRRVTIESVGSRTGAVVLVQTI